MKTIILIVLSMLATACATTEHTVKDIETKNIEVKGSVDGGKLAITEKGQVIIQVERSVEDEIRSQDMVNTYFHDELGYESGALNQCRVEMANPKLGGSGEVTPLPADVSLLIDNETKEEIGLNEDGDLKIVRREFMDQRLAKMRKLQVTMEHMIKTLKPMREECQRKLGYKRDATVTETYYDRTVSIVHTSK